MPIPTDLRVGPEPLKIADRCDKCGAQAFVRVRLDVHFELLFCGHDYAANQDRIAAAKPLAIDDFRNTINSGDARALAPLPL